MSRESVFSTWKGRIALMAFVVLIALPFAYKLWDTIVDDVRQARATSALVARAEAAFSSGEFGGAVAAYARARAMDPQNDRIIKGLARARTFLAAWSPDLIRSVDAEDILLDARRIAIDFPGDKAVAEAAMGHIYGTTGRLKEAAQHYTASLAADPTCGPAHLGQALLWRNDEAKTQDAIKGLREVLKVRPKHPETSAMLGKLLLGTGETAEAISLLKEVIEQREDPGARIDLATALVGEGKADAALEHWKRATQLDPRSAEAWAGLGNAYAMTRKFQEAEQALRRALAIQPTANTTQRLATVLNRMGRYREALGMFQQLADRSDENPFLSFEMAIATEGLGDKEQAAKLYERVASTPSPDDKALAQAFEAVQKQARERLKALRPGADAGSSPVHPAPGSDSQPPARPTGSPIPGGSPSSGLKF